MSSFRVSVQAFIEQIESWGITLGRETKKLKQLKSSIRNKFKLNSVEIVLTEIESLQIQYKKIKNKYKQFSQTQNRNTNLEISNQAVCLEELLAEYSQLSKSFMDLLEKVALIEEEQDQANGIIVDVENQDGMIDKMKQQGQKYSDKHFLNQTFSFKVSKENKNNSNTGQTQKNKSIFDKRNSYKEKQPSSKINTSTRQKAYSVIDHSNISLHNPKIKPSKNSKHPFKHQPLISAVEDQDRSLWQIRHQLAKITQMMKEMKNEIKFHEHEETNKQINKIENKNRKIASELKSVKQENRFIIDKIDELKRQLMEEKKMQVDLINKFEKKTYLGNTALYDSRATHGENYRSVNLDQSQDRSKSSNITNRQGEQGLHNVSDWVKMRI